MKVLYILGGSRTGSTIVDNILNEIDGFFSGGEIRFLWERILEGRFCGCRRSFGDCSVWSAVLRDSFGFPQASTIDIDEVARWQRESLRVVRTPRILRAVRSGDVTDASLRAFADVADRLYSGLGDVTGARVIVDSSKRGSNGALLGLLPHVSAYYVHLVRDPRAVAYSRRRPKLNPDGRVPREMGLTGPVNSAISWLGWNLASEAVTRRTDPSRVLVVRYEEFSSRPAETIRRITQLLGEDGAALPFVDQTTVRLRGNHTVSGNPSRFTDGIVPVRADDEWATNMATADRAVVTVLTAPMLVRYGYPLRAETTSSADHRATAR